MVGTGARWAAFGFALLAACGGRTSDGERAATSGAEMPERVRVVAAALKTRDGRQLAALTHPTKGVRFSSSAFVRVDSDVVVSRRDVERLFADTTKRVWGHADGTGDPLHSTFADYYRRYVYPVDFAAAPEVRYNQGPARAGNTPSNLRTAYPGAQWAELHFPGFDPKYDGMDWQSLWLVFEPHAGEWFLTGVVHGSWTI
jgi:hypothetical protein